MKNIFYLLLLIPFSGISQNYISQGNVAFDTTTRQFVMNSPTNTFGNRRDVTIAKDSTLYTNRYLTTRLEFYGSSRNNGTITGGLSWFDSNGFLQRSPITSLPISSGQISSGLGFTPYNATNPSGYLDQSGARNAISVTTTGSGAASYNSSTGVINIPTPASSKRIETYLGTTDGSGNYTVTYGTAFSSTPDVQPQLQSGTTSQLVRITSTSTTGFTVQVTNRASVTLLGIEVLLAATTAVSGASVGVLVTQR